MPWMSSTLATISREYFRLIQEDNTQKLITCFSQHQRNRGDISWTLSFISTPLVELIAKMTGAKAKKGTTTKDCYSIPLTTNNFFLFKSDFDPTRYKVMLGDEPDGYFELQSLSIIHMKKSHNLKIEMDYKRYNENGYFQF